MYRNKRQQLIKESTDNLIIGNNAHQYTPTITNTQGQNDKKVRVTENCLVLTVTRVELDDDQLADVRSQARESGINLEEFLLEIPKKFEGYLRLDEDK